MKEDQSTLLVYLLISLWYGHCNTCSLSIEEETDRRESKGRRRKKKDKGIITANGDT